MTIHVGLISGGNITETHALAARHFRSRHSCNLWDERGKGRSAVSPARRTPVTGFRSVPHAPSAGLGDHGKPVRITRHSWHAAVLHGLHVLTEKPIDISTQRADALIEAANQSNVKLGVIFQDRLKADIRRFKQWVDEGALGNPLLVDARVKWHRHAEYYRNSKWRGTFALDGGGALMNRRAHGRPAAVAAR